MFKRDFLPSVFSTLLIVGYERGFVPSSGMVDRRGGARKTHVIRGLRVVGVTGKVSTRKKTVTGVLLKDSKH